MEAYPIKEEWVGNQYGGLEDINSLSREKYQEGYGQAFQDFLEKAEKFIEDTQIENFICRDDGIYFDNGRFIEQFKNYVQNE